MILCLHIYTIVSTNPMFGNSLAGASTTIIGNVFIRATIFIHFVSNNSRTETVVYIIEARVVGYQSSV